MRPRHRPVTADDFRLLFSRGKRIESPLFRLLWLKSVLPYSRVACVASRAVDKRAVVRNRLRRRTREWCRKHAEYFHTPIDLAIILKKDAAASTRASFYEELERATTSLYRHI